MPHCPFPITEACNRIEALLKQRHGDRPYTPLEREEAAEQVAGEMQAERSGKAA